MVSCAVDKTRLYGGGEGEDGERECEARGIVRYLGECVGLFFYGCVSVAWETGR